MNILFIGDIVGKGGRKAVKTLIPDLRREFNCSFCIANAENIAGGAGVTAKCLHDLNSLVDVFTLGDHVWDQKGFEQEIYQCENVVRPANLHHRQPGKGMIIKRNPGGGDVAVINLQGKVFMRDSAQCPFEVADSLVDKVPASVKCIIVDMHAEATSEKAAMAYYLDGRVTAVLGTHTHVQSADAKILPNRTAFISDIGMVGGEYSVLGRTVPSVIEKFTTGMPTRLPVVEKGNIRLDAAILSYDYQTGKAIDIQAISRFIEI